MSEKSVDATVIKKTQDTLGKYVKKPALTEKLLNKPPFRFIHDIVNAVIKETGFLDGLYSKSELNSENIKDRDAKLKFLQKLIDVIKLTTSENVSAKPSKIVAGHEADKTNELLQLIGIAIEKKLDYKQAIEKYQNQGDSVKIKAKTKEKEASTKESKTIADKKDDVKGKKLVKNQPVKNATTKTASNTKTSSKPATKLKDPAKSSDKKTKKEPKGDGKATGLEKIGEIREDPTLVNTLKSSNEVIANGSALQKSKDSAGKNRQNSQETISNDQQDDSKVEPKVRKQSLELESKQASKKPEVEVDHATENHKSSSELTEVTVKPPQIETKEPASDEVPKERKKSSSKRRKSVIADEIKNPLEDHPDGPRNRKKESSAKSKDLSDPILDISQQQLKDISTTTEVNRQSTFVREDSQNDTKPARPKTSLRPPSVRPASARPGAPRRRDKNVEIILQPNDQVKLAGINVRLESFESQLEDDGENLVIVENVDTHENEKNSREGDVLLDGDAQQGHLVQQILQTQKELINLDSDVMSNNDVDVVTLQKRQSSARQMDSLRDVIQSLTRSINPLGKLMDFLPEDIDSMHLEMNMWRDSYIQASGELKKEKSLTESAIEPMKNQLAQISSNVKEYKDMIEQIRMKILQNSDKIYKLLIEQ